MNTKTLLINENKVYKAELNLVFLNAKLVFVVWVYDRDERLYMFKMKRGNRSWMIIETAQLPEWLKNKEPQLAELIIEFIRSMKNVEMLVE